MSTTRTPLPRRTGGHPRAGFAARLLAGLTWFAPLAMLGAVALGAAVVLRAPLAIFGTVLGGLFAVVLLWVVLSILWPGRADRTCPSCSEPGLRRMDRNTTRGLACDRCGWSDETESGWFLAEEEGPLEDIVLRDRGRI